MKPATLARMRTSSSSTIAVPGLKAPPSVVTELLRGSGCRLSSRRCHLPTLHPIMLLVVSANLSMALCALAGSGFRNIHRNMPRQPDARKPSSSLRHRALPSAHHSNPRHRSTDHRTPVGSFGWVRAGCSNQVMFVGDKECNPMCARIKLVHCLQIETPNLPLLHCSAITADDAHTLHWECTISPTKCMVSQNSGRFPGSTGVRKLPTANKLQHKARHYYRQG